MEGPGNQCAVCGSSVSVVCSQCETVAYCGPEHQKSHWLEHKTLCTPYTIQRSDTLGRYLVASRDIKAGEVILKELPLVLGPRVDSSPICIGCYKPLPMYQPNHCSQCLVAPVCGAQCERNGDHSDVEYHSQMVLPFRCLLQIKNSSTDPRWNSFLELESHEKERRDTLIWRDHQLNVVEVMRTHELLCSKEEADLMQRICGILDVNSFEVRGPVSKSGDSERLRGVYLRAALMAHDCLANTHLAVDDSFQMTIHASVLIPRSQAIYFNYTNTMQGTLDRQAHLREGKYFHCTCRRCSDPTEEGTHMSSIRCVRCKDGFIIPTDPTTNQQKWECNKCNHHYRHNMIKTTVSLARSFVDEVDRTDYRAMEALLIRLSRTFPPQHFVLLELKQTLVAVYRDIINRETNPSRKVLSRKLQLCRDMLPILEVVEPGISRLRGIALYELQDPIVMLANKDFEGGEITVRDLLSKLREAEGYLREAISQLIYEPMNSPEGHLARVAMQDLKNLRYSIQHAEKLVSETETRKSSTGSIGSAKKRGGGRKKKT
ncbi:hypothetical protein L9F63_025224 [Diploptera punctata]|uniref:MYND-type domain-containing protein n=1 Tax=Diploptera punctata TaxID=6984 RepID=A0AAD7ZCC1_DIPPU|nr:hypothetical protein L9F63_025224 [Diploptera punctata]